MAFLHLQFTTVTPSCGTLLTASATVEAGGAGPRLGSCAVLGWYYLPIANADLYGNHATDSCYGCMRIYRNK
jgi:hypothetical protein